MTLTQHLILGFPAGVFLASLIEWQMHRVLHARGRVRGTFWSFHFYTHHGVARNHGFEDHTCGPRPRMILWTALGTAPVAWLAPGVALGVVATAAAYWFIHKKAHHDPAWALRWVPWHVEHHMAQNEEANWGVVTPWVDWIMGTRVPYLGTPRASELRPIAGQRPSQT